MRRFAITAAASFIAIILASVFGSVLESTGHLDGFEFRRAVEIGILGVIGVAFVVLVYSVPPLFLRIFILGQERIGNGDLLPIRFLRANERHVCWAIWILMSVGLMMAIPAAIMDGLFEIPE